MARKAAPKRTADPARRVLEAALSMAGEAGWESLRLREVARACGLSMAELRALYRDTDAVADAWFAAAQDAMLQPVPKGFSARPTAERLEFLIWRWFAALAPHHGVTAEMIAAKLWVFHPHHYVPMVFNLSRLIQWWRDAAGLDAGGRRRQIEEIALTALFLSVLRHWCRDDSLGQTETLAFLKRRLARADAAAARLFRD